jgi:hypothetical protein
MKTFLQIAGALQLILSVFHFAFARRLGWREDLQRVSLFTRQVFWVHMGFLMLVLAGFGGLSLIYAEELLTRSPLSRAMLGGLTVFWAARWYCQLFVYRAELWRGNAFKTKVHVSFVLLWTFLTAVYATAFWRLL